MSTHVNDFDHNDDRSPQAVALRYQFNELTKSQQILLAKVDRISDRLLDPDSGLVVKVRVIEDRAGESSTKIATLTTNIEQLEKICTNHNQRVEELETLHESNNTKVVNGISALSADFDAIASSLVKLNNDFETRRNTRKRLDKLLGFIIIVILAILGPAVKSWIEGLNQKTQSADTADTTK